MLYLYTRITNWFRSEEGQDLIEYALLAALIAVALILVLPAVSRALSTIFSTIISTLSPVTAYQP